MREKNANVNYVHVDYNDDKPKRPLEYYESEDGSSSCSMRTPDDDEYEKMEVCENIDDHIEQALKERKQTLKERKRDEEKVNHPTYYNRYSVEVIEMAHRIWGDEAMKTAAEITAFIYRMRAGVKPDNPIEQDLAKEDFWLNYAKKING